MKILKPLITSLFGFYLFATPLKSQEQIKINLSTKGINTSTIAYHEIKDYLLKEINSKEVYEAIELDSGKNINLNLRLTLLDLDNAEIGKTAAYYDNVNDEMETPILPVNNDELKATLMYFLVHELKHKIDLGPESDSNLFGKSKNYTKKLRLNKIPAREDTLGRLEEITEIERRGYDAMIKYFKIKANNSQSEELSQVYKKFCTISENDKKYRIERLENDIKNKK